MLIFEATHNSIKTIAAFAFSKFALNRISVSSVFALLPFLFRAYFIAHRTTP